MASPAQEHAQRIREVAARFRVEGQWLEGRVCTPARRTLLDQLNLGEPFLRTGGVALPGKAPMDFLALRAEAIELLVPADGQELIAPDSPPVNFVPRPVRCLLPGVVLEGTLQILDRVRVSDHMMRCPGFIALRDCSLQISKYGAASDVTHPEIALVNTRRVLGVSDFEAPTES